MSQSIKPEDYLVQIRGGAKYLPVAPRLVMFRDRYPQGNIETELVHFDPELKLVIAKCTIHNGEGGVIAVAFGSCARAAFPRPLEKAMTCAIGRALAQAGLGTLMGRDFAEDEDDDPKDFVQPQRSAPVEEAKPEPKRKPRASAPATTPESPSVLQSAPAPIAEADENRIMTEFDWVEEMRRAYGKELQLKEIQAVAAKLFAKYPTMSVKKATTVISATPAYKVVLSLLPPPVIDEVVKAHPDGVVPVSVAVGLVMLDGEVIEEDPFEND